MRQTVFPDENDAQDNLQIEDKYFQLLFPILKKAQDRGELRKNIELLHITGHFYGLYILIISSWYIGRIPTEEIGSALELIFRQALEGLQPHSDPKS